MDKYVLVVDDHPDVRQLILDVLATMKIPAKEAMNGQEALNMLQEHQPSAIVLDIMMPVMNGFTFLTQMYASGPDRSIPVILLSGVADDTQMRKLPGVVGVLRKGGFKIDELRTMLKAALNGGQAPAASATVPDGPKAPDAPNAGEVVTAKVASTAAEVVNATEVVELPTFIEQPEASKIVEGAETAESTNFVEQADASAPPKAGV